MHKILIVEDDPQISSLLQSYLEKYGYEGVIVSNFDQVLSTFQEVKPDLVILDVNLPRFDGFYWCRQIRTQSTCPILFVSARDDKMDQVIALQNGADDYITKPFHPEVLLAKIESNLRRAYGLYAGVQKSRSITVSGLNLYPDTMELMFHDKQVEMSHKETALLELLMTYPKQVVGRVHLLEALWDDYQYVGENTLNVYVTRVRKKLSELGLEDIIETVRGAGYRLHLTEEEEQ
ncbi:MULTISPECIES: response regulator transcription factor [Paenibacillus]|uniref:Sensory transduction protein n=1 Tax=Paenibacillus polymyxa TaxID=1406 RepID=A0A378Y574_PAEPO|nr:MULTISPECIES: response regulator transcription factor [Paenibacillus]KAF6583239.1 response regulator transcription factor [Paenibacillus sp. EKM211P]MBE7898737.1 response regulator transcription factor [Paenibacillus polymyxa]MBG9766777.1 transcriptional regulator [Paenibacillus polymyxa]MCC3260399.1 response regulator transcription factor [Paenibacillus polymyxa]QPK53524.1 response regulator transcription factor [Paenibacillus polymyxa]